MKRVQRQAINAAKVYLNMRGFELIEQSWSQGKNKVDLIAGKNGRIYFIELKEMPENDNGHTLDLLTSSYYLSRNNAAAAWLKENKNNTEPIFALIELAEPNHTIINYIEGSF